MKTSKLICAMCMMMFLSGGIASATTYTWYYNGAAFWGGGTNWAPTGIPGQNDTAYVTKGEAQITDANAAAAAVRETVKVPKVPSNIIICSYQQGE